MIDGTLSQLVFLFTKEGYKYLSSKFKPALDSRDPAFISYEKGHKYANSSILSKA